MRGEKTVLLVNPASGNGSTGRRWPELAREAEAAGLRGETRTSEAPGHITDLARRAGHEGAALVVVVGGDGTVNEAVNGLMQLDAHRPELAVVLRGTGKDFGRTYGIPTSPRAAFAVARDGAARTIDVGRVRYATESGGETRYFANIASVGLSGAVARRANSTSKALGGKVGFFVALVQTFARWRNVGASVDVDGQRREGRMTSVIVANGQYQGGGMWICPGAASDDGLLDVLVIGDITKVDFVLNVARIYRGTHLGHPKLELLRGAVVRVDAAEPQPLEVDGEQPGTTPAVFDVVRDALRVRVPAS